MIEDCLFKFKNRYIIYSKRKKQSNKLAIIFSGVDATSSFCRMSHYGLGDELEANCVHIMDNFGAHGCYLLSISGDVQIRNAVLQLIKELQEDLKVTLDDLYLVGTSKGGSTAIAYALMLGGGNVIAGEPQILLGNFIYNKDWRELEQWRSLAYAMTGRVNEEDKTELNNQIPQIAERYGGRFEGSMEIHYGNTGYWENHLQFFSEIVKTFRKPEKIMFVPHDFRSHNDVIPIFSERVKGCIGGTKKFASKAASL